MIEVIEIKARNTIKTVKSTNHVFVVDVSGSMFNDLPKMRTHLKNNLSSIVKDNDTVSVLYFSGKGQCGVVFSGLEVKSSHSISTVQKAIDMYLTPIGLTGFVEPLQLAVVTANSINNDNLNNLIFMSDGYDNQWSEKQIINQCRSLNSIYDKITFIEYGYYADRDMIAKMAAESGGNHIFTERYESYESEFENIITQDTVETSEYDIKKAKAAAYINNNDIIVLEPKQGIVNVPVNVSKLYSISENEISKTEDEKLKYIALYYAVHKVDTDLAWKCLEALGDVNLIDKFTNVFTKQDFTNYKEEVKQCVFDDNKRFIKGIDYNHAPKEDAYTILDLVNELTTGDNFLVLDSDEFKYNRTGRSTELSQDLEYKPVFELTSPTVSLNNIVTNENRPNISINTIQYGSVEIPQDKADSLNIPKAIPTKQYRNYTVVKDGIINMKNLPVVLDDDTKQNLIDNGVDVYPNSNNTHDIINCESLPLINRKMTRDITAQSFLEAKVKLEEVKAYQKVFKFYKDKLIGKTASQDIKSKYGEAAAQYLAELGIKDYGFSPKVTQREATDFYMSKELSVKIKGLSSLPSVNAVIKKVEGNKKLNVADSMINEAINLIEKEIEASDNNATLLKWIDSKTTEYVNLARTLMDILSKTVYSIVVGKVWFKECDSHEDNTFTVEYKGSVLDASIDIVEKEIKI